MVWSMTSLDSADDVVDGMSVGLGQVVGRTSIDGVTMECVDCVPCRAPILPCLDPESHLRIQSSGREMIMILFFGGEWESKS